MVKLLVFRQPFPLDNGVRLTMSKFRTKLFFTNLVLAAAFLGLSAVWWAGQNLCLLAGLICVVLGTNAILVQVLTAKVSRPERPEPAEPDEFCTTRPAAKLLPQTADTEPDIEFPDWQSPASLEPHSSLDAHQSLCSYDISLEQYLSGRHYSDTLSLQLPSKLAEDTAETASIAAMTYHS
jgi:hypothetical protein